MKKRLFALITLIATLLCQSHAQYSNGNPFARLGYKASVATFGDKEEFHDGKAIVEIGTVYYDTRIGKVVGFVENRDSLVELPPAVISTSIDPLCEKYYSVTPYGYCFNNPLRFVDPDGRDVWEMDHSGRVKWIKESETHTMYALNEDGARTGQSIAVKDRSILDQLSADPVKSYNGNYAVTKSSEAGDVFTFAANNSTVEWGISKFKNGEYVVHTSHDNSKVSSATNIEGYNEKNMVFKTHSHPGEDGPKGASMSSALRDDMGNIAEMANRFDKAKIYTEKNFPKHFVYHPYSKNLYQYTPYNSSILIGPVNKNATLNMRILNSKSAVFKK